MHSIMKVFPVFAGLSATPLPLATDRHFLPAITQIFQVCQCRELPNVAILREELAHHGHLLIRGHWTDSRQVVGYLLPQGCEHIFKKTKSLGPKFQKRISPAIGP